MFPFNLNCSKIATYDLQMKTSAVNKMRLGRRKRCRPWIFTGHKCFNFNLNCFISVHGADNTVVFNKGLKQYEFKKQEKCKS